MGAGRMITGQAAGASGTYRSDCACRASVPVRRGETAPGCPRCGKTVGWTIEERAPTAAPAATATAAPAATPRPTSHPIRRRALLVEDSAADARLTQEQLRTTEFPTIDVDHVTTLAAALERLSKDAYTVVLLDLGLPDSHGIATAIRVIETYPTVPVVVFTGLEDERVGIAAIQEGAQDYIVKNQVTVHALRRAIEYAIQRQDLLARTK
jgi:CheY-like chemotaxis protein